MSYDMILSNGVIMPMRGFGTFKIKDGDEVKKAVTDALQAGYRHIDTAAIYGNEVGVGDAIKESGIDRTEIFLVSKVWNSDQGYDKTKEAFKLSLEKLKTDYLDLYLIHWPKELNMDTWRAMEELYLEGKIKAIGVSNFKEHHLEEIMKSAKIIPMVNQVELHPQFPQHDLHEYCNKYDIKLTAWAPLMQGEIFSKEVMKALAEKKNKSIAQIALRWAYQMNIITLAKSINKDRIRNNYDIESFELSEEDMNRINALNTGKRIGPDPDKIDF